MDEDILSDEEIVEEARNTEQLASDQLKEDIQKVAATPEGLRFLKHLVVKFGLYQGSFTGNSRTFYNEGWRALGLSIFDDFLMALEPEIIGQLVIIHHKGDGNGNTNTNALS